MKYKLTFDLNLIVGKANVIIGSNTYSYTTLGRSSESIFFDVSNDISSVAFTAITVDGTFYIDNVSLISIADSSTGRIYNLPITDGNDSTWYHWQYYGYWKQKDGDTIWVYSDIDSVFTPDYYIAPDEEGLYTIDGNKLYTSDGNRIFAKQEE